MLSKFIIFGVLFLDVIGIAILIPAFPELKAYYHINDFQVTLGLTLYSLFAFFATPLLGQISDRYGRKKPLMRCVLGTCLSYLLLLITAQYWIFLLSRILNGITGGNISILQAILTDISPDAETKSKNYGMMGALFGLGFIVGPLIGALILQFGEIHHIFWFGALFALGELLLIWMHLPNTQQTYSHKALKFDSLGLIYSYLKHKHLKHFLISLILLGIGGFILNATMGLYMNTHFAISGAEYGYFLAFLGLVSAFNLGFLTPKFWIRFFGYKTLIRIAHLALIIGYAWMGLTHSLVLFMILFVATILLSGGYMTVYNMQIMSQAKPDEIGTLSGMLGGLQNGVMFVGPLAGGIIMSAGYNIFAGACVCFALSLIVMIKFLLQGSPTGLSQSA